MQKLVISNRIEGKIEWYMTQHAWERMTGRGISSKAVQAVLEFGRVAYVRGATICAIGRNEVKRFAKHGINLSCYEGIQVVCSFDGAIMTAYRNRDFRGLRPRRRLKNRNNQQQTLENSHTNV